MKSEQEEGCEFCGLKENCNNYKLGKEETILAIQNLIISALDYYPKDIYPELNKNQLERIHDLLLREFKFPLDRLSAHLMRLTLNNLREEIKEALSTILNPDSVKSESHIKFKGCGKPEINSKTGNVSICCGDTLDERLNHETGETEFLNYYCSDCKTKKDALSAEQGGKTK